MTSILSDRIQAAVVARLSPARWAHTSAVAETAAVLARSHGADPGAAVLAGLLHDYAREMPSDRLLALAGTYGLEVDAIETQEPLLLHGKVGAALARSELGVCDESILQAVATHITGAPGMSILSRIVFLADFIEPGRSYDSAALARAAAGEDLSRALLIAFDAIISYVLAAGYLLHPRTVAARNELLQTRACHEP